MHHAAKVTQSAVIAACSTVQCMFGLDVWQICGALEYIWNRKLYVLTLSQLKFTETDLWFSSLIFTSQRLCITFTATCYAGTETTKFCSTRTWSRLPTPSSICWHFRRADRMFPDVSLCASKCQSNTHARIHILYYLQNKNLYLTFKIYFEE